MLDEIILKTRGEGGNDFVWFASGIVGESWKGKYETPGFYKADSEVNLFAEIENGNYHIYFDKIFRPWKITRSGIPTTPYVDLMAQGKCGSESSKAFFKILTNYFFGKKDEVERLFAEIIPKDFIEEAFVKAKAKQMAEVEKQISEKLEEIVTKLSDVEISKNRILKDNKFVFDGFEKNKNAFFTELKRITEPSERKEYVSFILTGVSVTNLLLESFDYSCFTSGLCLSTGSVEITEKVRTIKDEPVKLPEPIHEETKKEDPFPIGGTTPSTTDTEKEPSEEDFVSKILSNPGLKRFLILLAVIILTLILAVRSCWKKSGENSPSKSSSTKEQKLSQDSLKNSTKSNDTLKVKFDK